MSDLVTYLSTMDRFKASFGHATKTHQLRYLQRKARAWGGRVSILKFRDFRHQRFFTKNFEIAPFSECAGLLWAEKVVLGSKMYGMLVPHLIHEMGHVFATTDHPEASEEQDFLYWEVALNRAAGVSFEEWLVGNRDYGLGRYEIGEAIEAAPAFFLEHMREARRTGIRVKNLTKDGQPVTVRK